MRSLLVFVTLVLGACAATRPAPVVDRGTVVNPNPASSRTAGQAVASGATQAARPAQAAGTAAPPVLSSSAAPASPVQVNPVAGPGTIESRSIEVRPAPPRGPAAGSVAPAASAPPPAQPPSAATSSGGRVERASGAGQDTVPGIKTEPRGYKLPWSEDNVALVQGSRRSPGVASNEPRAAEPRADGRAAETKPADTKSADTKSADTKPGDAKSGSGEARPDPKPEVRLADPAVERPEFAWPLKGRILERFEGGSRGIAIAGNEGDPVLAAAGGTVLYAGSGIRGYGQLLIVKHNDNFISVYAHNSRLLVKQGDGVRSGQKIAEVGHTDANRSKLHFEIRRQGTSIDPLQYLPARD
jgi:lipoprotein NlpD